VRQAALMWRIPVFILGFCVVFFGITWVSAALAHAHVYWAAVTVLGVGAGTGGVAAFPALNWVIYGRGVPFYRRDDTP
jgi:hypothetical protein